MKISSSKHPDYTLNYEDWVRFRFIVEGGTAFIEEYLESYSTREDAAAFIKRKRISTVPSFASSSIVDIKNAIFQRMNDITRINGTTQFREVNDGKLGGVDLHGATANYFIGNKVLPELLNMGKVGVYADMPVISSTSVSETQKKHPYYYEYKVENIRNWCLAQNGEYAEFTMLLLRETALEYDEDFKLPVAEYTRYRLLTKTDAGVEVKFYDEDDNQINIDGFPTNEAYLLNIKTIPFVLFELNESLLKNIANHQIALLNLESSDIAYTLLANFPFYVEKDNKMGPGHLKNDESGDGSDAEIRVGATTGRTYSGEKAPEFIHPSPAPLMASMEKQKQLKDDIRALVNLALSAVQPKFASAESKAHDEHGLESGLSFIGLILEHGERRLADLFAEYEGSGEVATIKYPTRYALKSDIGRIEEAKALEEMVAKVPSNKGQKEIIKLMTRKLLDTKIPQEKMQEILNEIESAKYLTSDPETLNTHIENGLVSTKTASLASGYAEGEAEKAKQDHADRLKLIQDTQTPRGITDLGTDPKASVAEKQRSQNSDNQDDSKKKVRGNGNN